MKIKDWLKKWYKRWPFIWPFLIVGVVSFFYIDGMVIPTLTKRHLIYWGIDLADLSWLIPNLSISSRFLIAEIISIPEIIYSYWFLGWLGRLTASLAKKLAAKEAQEEEIIKDLIERGESIKLQLEQEGYIDWIQSKLVQRWKKITDEDNKFWRYLKRGGIGAFMLFAISPEPFARTAAMIACRTIGNKRYLTLLIICDAIKTGYMVLGWHVVFHKLSWQVTLILGSGWVLFWLYKKYKKRS